MNFSKPKKYQNFRIRSSNPPKTIKRVLISQKEVIGKNGKPKIEYKYDYRYTTDQPASIKDRTYAESLHIPNKIRNETLRIYQKGSRVLADYEDSKGRKIHKYSTNEIYKNVKEKYKRNKLFADQYQPIVNKLRQNIDITTKDGQSSLILYIIYKTGLRIGSNSDTKSEQKAYGVSTLLHKHVKLLPNGGIKFDFIGKKGIRNTAIVRDPIIYGELSKMKTSNWSQNLFDVSNSYVRSVLKNIDDRFDIKDFRTLKANQIAMKEIEKRKGPAPTEKIFKKWQREVADVVANELGNTRSVALNDYIDPDLWNIWRLKEWGVWKPAKLIEKDD